MSRLLFTLLRKSGGGAALDALTVLSTYGANAWMWIPGVGTVSGFDAKNWLNANYTTALAVDQQVGSASCASPAGAIGIEQATAGSRPFLRNSGGVYSWEFDGTDDRMGLASAPFSFPNDHILIVGCTPTTAATTKTIFSLRNGGNRIELTHTTGNLLSMQLTGSPAATITPPTTYLDVPVVVSCQSQSNLASMRINGAHSAEQPNVIATFTPTANYVGVTNGGGFAGHYKGKLHGVILVKGAVTHEEKVALETLIATLSGITITPEKARTFYSVSSLLPAYMGNYTLASNVYRMEQSNGALFLKINASSAEMLCTAGDTTPYRIMVDTEDYAEATTPAGLTEYGTTTGTTSLIKKISLFNGVGAERKVLVFSDNSNAGQSFGDATTGSLLALTGDSVSVTPVGTTYYCADPAFPGVITNPRVVNTSLPAYSNLSNGSAWSSRYVGSIHFRAKFTTMYVFTKSDLIEVSVDGGSFTRYTMAARLDVGGFRNRGWRRVPITGNGTLQSIIIAGATSTALTGGEGVITGVMLSGSAPEMQAPSGTRRHLAQFGASQTEGVGCEGFIDTHLVQDRLPIYVISAGQAGKKVEEAIVGTIFADWAAELPYRDILLLSIGINDTDMPNFQSNYQNLIGKAITAGFNRVICRGLGFPLADAKNLLIDAAVTAVSDPRVVYASIDSWTGIAGVHPDRTEYLLMAGYSVRDHSAFYS